MHLVGVSCMIIKFFVYLHALVSFCLLYLLSLTISVRDERRIEFDFGCDCCSCHSRIVLSEVVV